MSTMKTRKKRDANIAFVLDETQLRRFVDILKRMPADLSYSASLSDGSTLYPSSLEELLEIPNTRSRTIRSITIETPWVPESQVQVKLDADKRFGGMSYDIRGEDRRSSSSLALLIAAWKSSRSGTLLCCTPPLQTMS